MPTKSIAMIPDKEIRYKVIVQVGENTIDTDMPQSLLIHKVLCNRSTVIDINKCFRCRHNFGALNQFLIKCGRDPGEDPPEEIQDDKFDFDYDYPDDDKKEETNDAD